STGNHDVRASVPDVAERFAQRDCSRAATVRIGVARTGQAEFDRYVRSTRSAEHKKGKGWIDGAQALTQEKFVLMLGQRHAAQCRPCADANVGLRWLAGEQ